MNFSPRRLHPHDREAALRAPARRCGRSSSQRGDIYLGKYAGWYSVRDEAYLRRKRDRGRARRQAPRDSTGAEVEWVEEPSLFLPAVGLAGAAAGVLRRATRDFIVPDSRRNEVISFVKGGLQDLSVSRTSFTLGRAGAGRSQARHVCLARRAHQLHHRSAAIPTRRDPLWKYWPADLHMVGKDIIRFHCGLLAGLPDGRRDRAAAARVRPRLVDQRGPEDLQVARQRHRSAWSWWTTYGLDPVRYFLLREVPFGNDGDFCRSARWSAA